MLSRLPHKISRQKRAMYECISHWLTWIGRELGESVVSPFWCTRDMAAGKQQKHLEFTFFTKALSFHSRTIIRADKHIF